MNLIRRQTSTLVSKFALASNKIARDKNNQDLDTAINSWCTELSINEYFPNVSTEIIENKNQWLQDNDVLTETLQLYRNLLVITDKKLTKVGIGNSGGHLENIYPTDFYHNVRKTKENMSAKSIVLIAFVLTGIGLLLFLLNKKENSNNSRSSNRRSNNAIAYQPLVREKHILALLIKSDRYQDLIHSLKDSKSNYLKPQDASKLYGATQGLWIGAKSKFENSQIKIKRELNNRHPVTTTSEYDVHFVTIELDEDDSRFYPDVNPMDRRDAFIELAERSPRITVSPRLSCKAYENTEFYSR